jgi:two-component system cell cycle response regulator
MKHVAHNASPTAPPEIEPQAVTSAKKKSKILIVDDSATIRATLSRAVKNEFPYLDAVNGEKAWRLIETDDSIRLVVTDLDMPELDGFGLIKRMRNSEVPRIRSMPVIVVTGENDTDAREQAFLAGANDFITKTSDHVEFLARVRAHEKLACTINELEENRRFLREQANTDPLTRLANRRSFFQMAASALAQIRRQHEHFSVIMIDIDYFKPINDTYGHQAGDHVLVEVSKVLANAVREGDVLARMGGEEFVVASPNTNRLAAIVLSERLRKSIETSEFVFEGNQIQVTISLGIASLTEEDEDIDKLLAIADSRLYLAKQKGRNCICASDKLAGQERLVDMDMVCPKLDEAMTMIKHGNTFRLMPHLHELSLQLLPLLELINEEGIDPPLDLEAINSSFNALDK